MNTLIYKLLAVSLFCSLGIAIMADSPKRTSLHTPPLFAKATAIEIFGDHFAPQSLLYTIKRSKSSILIPKQLDQDEISALFEQLKGMWPMNDQEYKGCLRAEITASGPSSVNSLDSPNSNGGLTYIKPIQEYTGLTTFSDGTLTIINNNQNDIHFSIPDTEDKESKSISHYHRIFLNDFEYPLLSSLLNGGESDEIVDCITDKDTQFEYGTFYSEGKWRLAIRVGSDHELSMMVFSTANEDGFVSGLHETSEYIEDSNGIRIDSNFLLRRGGGLYRCTEYTIRSIQKDNSGNILELAMDFNSTDMDGYALEGSIRYNSDFPVNLEKPFKL